jgi:hypothetical protein
MNGQAVEALWQKVLAAALLGTARQPFALPKAEGTLGALLSQLDSADPEGALLSAAAILSYVQRCGAVPALLGRALPSPCPPDPQPAMSPEAAALLLRLDAKRPYLLEEWLQRAFAHGKRVPESYAPDLLTLSEQIQPALGALVVGVRGRWLAMQLGGKWTYAAFQLDDDSAWRTGAFSTRKTFLSAVRLLEPERARQLLAETWEREPAQQRADLLDALIYNLSEADLLFLSQVAQIDRALSVRERATGLIERLRQASSPEQREAEASLLFGKRAWQAKEFALIGRCDHSWSQAFSERFAEHMEQVLRSAIAANGTRWQDSSFPTYFEPLLAHLHPEALSRATAALEAIAPSGAVAAHIAQWQATLRLRAEIQAAF